MMARTAEEYTAQLARHLRARGLDEAQISKAARMVKSFVADSGSTADETFGSPRRYARTFTPATAGSPPGRGWQVAAWLLATLAAVLLLVSWSARDEDELLGLISPQVGIVVGSAVLLMWAMMLGMQLARGLRR